MKGLAALLVIASILALSATVQVNAAPLGLDAKQQQSGSPSSLPFARRLMKILGFSNESGANVADAAQPDAAKQLPTAGEQTVPASDSGAVVSEPSKDTSSSEPEQKDAVSTPSTTDKPAEEQKPAAAAPEQQAAAEPKPQQQPATQADKPAAAEPKPAEQPAAEPKPAEQPAAEPKPAEQPAAEPKPAEQPAAEPKPAEQPAATAEPQPVEQPATKEEQKPADSKQPSVAQAPQVKSAPDSAPHAKHSSRDAPLMIDVLTPKGAHSSGAAGPFMGGGTKRAMSGSVPSQSSSSRYYPKPRREDPYYEDRPYRGQARDNYSPHDRYYKVGHVFDLPVLPAAVFRRLCRTVSTSRSRSSSSSSTTAGPLQSFQQTAALPTPILPHNRHTNLLAATCPKTRTPACCSSCQQCYTPNSFMCATGRPQGP